MLAGDGLDAGPDEMDLRGARAQLALQPLPLRLAQNVPLLVGKVALAADRIARDRIAVVARVEQDHLYALPGRAAGVGAADARPLPAGVILRHVHEVEDVRLTPVPLWVGAARIVGAVVVVVPRANDPCRLAEGTVAGPAVLLGID
jgi:hypothetical protein